MFGISVSSRWREFAIRVNMGIHCLNLDLMN
jgi:hypothetical protein